MDRSYSLLSYPRHNLVLLATHTASALAHLTTKPCQHSARMHYPCRPECGRYSADDRRPRRAGRALRSRRRSRRLPRLQADKCRHRRCPPERVRASEVLESRSRASFSSMSTNHMTTSSKRFNTESPFGGSSKDSPKLGCAGSVGSRKEAIIIIINEHHHSPLQTLRSSVSRFSTSHPGKTLPPRLSTRHTATCDGVSPATSCHPPFFLQVPGPIRLCCILLSVEQQ